ncbi:hypothetical protein [Variovorax sp. UC122_21]|uniref:hypothetical protein n=1 Tax=Variovorax sp. UC122_21 TaxID=3374554 RepID=UPI00375775DC
MSNSYYYWGHDTLTKIHVGSGRIAWVRWGLMDHAGPFFHFDSSKASTSRYAYLPPDLLELLYGRFRMDNPSGTTSSVNDLFEAGLREQGRFTEQEMDEMYDRREALFSIDVEKSDEGYPHVHPYLPELFEPATVRRLTSDPWLDMSLLQRAEFLGPDRGGIRHDLWVDGSARWSVEWRAFCDQLTSIDWSPTNSWEESTLHPESRFYRYRDEEVPYWVMA